MQCGLRAALTGWTTTGGSARRRSTRSSDMSGAACVHISSAGPQRNQDFPREAFVHIWA
jgi:hypothetical protein